MLSASLRRGAVAGLVAGLLSGFAGLLVGGPALDAAVALEEAAAGSGHAEAARGRTAAGSGHAEAGAGHAEAGAGHAEDGRGAAGTTAPGAGTAGQDAGAAGDDGAAMPRAVQKAGLVAGASLVGVALGLLFGLASAWASGRVTGDGWARSVKLGAVALGGFVLLPGLAYPPLPPGVEAPAGMAQRTGAYLLVVAAGLLLAAAGWLAARRLAEAGWTAPGRQALLGTLLLAGIGVVLAVRPTPAGAGVGFPPELLWRFRLGAIATQALLYGGTAVMFGLLGARAEAAVVGRGAGTAAR